MKPSRYTPWLATLLLTLPGLSHAHTLGPEAGFAAGLLHPLTGLDHLLTFIAVGFWARRMGGAPQRFMPPALLIAVACGASLGMLGAHGAWVEVALWSGTPVMCWLAVRGTAASATPNVLLISALGILHGFAHVAGAPAQSGLPAFVAGVLISSAALLVAGALLACATRMQPSATPSRTPH